VVTFFSFYTVHNGGRSKKGRVCIVEYQDAAYSYDLNLPDDEVVPPTVTSHCCNEITGPMTNGEKVSVYWEDIRKYNNNEERVQPTQMYTEGTFIKEAEGYVLIKYPETINFNTLKNHPEKKPGMYAIPLSLIKEIKGIE